MTIPDFARRDPIWCDFTIVYQGFLPQDKTEKLRKLGFYMAKSDWAIQLHFFSTFNGIKFWQNLTAIKRQIEWTAHLQKIDSLIENPSRIGNPHKIQNPCFESSFDSFENTFDSIQMSNLD